MHAEPAFDFDAMSSEEHQELAREAGGAGSCGIESTLSPALRAALDRRIEAYRRNPEAGVPWQVVEENVLRHLEEQERDSAP